MNKLLSILFTIVILLSGLNLSVDTHICGGEVAAVKFSVFHQKASCGMEIKSIETPSEPSFQKKSCCKDEMSVLTVDTNYDRSTLEINKPALQLIQIFYIPQIIGIQSNTFSVKYTNVMPPGKFHACDVSLPDICVFLI